MTVGHCSPKKKRCCGPHGGGSRHPTPVGHGSHGRGLEPPMGVGHHSPWMPGGPHGRGAREGRLRMEGWRGEGDGGGVGKEGWGEKGAQSMNEDGEMETRGGENVDGGKEGGKEKEKEGK